MQDKYKIYLVYIILSILCILCIILVSIYSTGSKGWDWFLGVGSVFLFMIMSLIIYRWEKAKKGLRKMTIEMKKDLDLKREPKRKQELILQIIEDNKDKEDQDLIPKIIIYSMFNTMDYSHFFKNYIDYLLPITTLENIEIIKNISKQIKNYNQMNDYTEKVNYRKKIGDDENLKSLIASYNNYKLVGAADDKDLDPEIYEQIKKDRISPIINDFQNTFVNYFKGSNNNKQDSNEYVLEQSKNYDKFDNLTNKYLNNLTNTYLNNNSSIEDYFENVLPLFDYTKINEYNIIKTIIKYVVFYYLPNYKDYILNPNYKKLVDLYYYKKEEELIVKIHFDRIISKFISSLHNMKTLEKEKYLEKYTLYKQTLEKYLGILSRNLYNQQMFIEKPDKNMKILTKLINGNIYIQTINKYKESDENYNNINQLYEHFINMYKNYAKDNYYSYQNDDDLIANLEKLKEGILSIENNASYKSRFDYLISSIFYNDTQLNGNGTSLKESAWGLIISNDLRKTKYGQGESDAAIMQELINKNTKCYKQIEQYLIGNTDEDKKKNYNNLMQYIRSVYGTEIYNKPLYYDNIEQYIDLKTPLDTFENWIKTCIIPNNN